MNGYTSKRIIYKIFSKGFIIFINHNKITLSCLSPYRVKPSRRLCKISLMSYRHLLSNIDVYEQHLMQIWTRDYESVPGGTDTRPLSEIYSFAPEAASAAADIEALITGEDPFWVYLTCSMPEQGGGVGGIKVVYLTSIHVEFDFLYCNRWDRLLE